MTADRPHQPMAGSAAEMNIFELCGPLPAVGVTLLEASAGTGKTFAIAALAARMVAAGHAIEDLLIVTFTRAAASELRSKVRVRLESSAKALRHYQESRELPHDEVDQLLCHSDDLSLVISRLNKAVSDIDLATIATLHEYSARMLAELGILADHDPASKFVDDLHDLVDEVVEDVIAAGGYRSAAATRERNWLARPLAIAQQVCEFPSWRIVPEDHVDYKFAVKVRAQFEARKRRIGVHGYSDMVERLQDALSDPHTGDLAAATLARRFPVVLVDEFQDTDPSQWQILRRAFAKRSTVILIGDPKQAIYGFRGGDVETYLLAKREADHVVTMGTNFRSDPAVVAGIAQLFAGASLGSPGSPILLPDVSAKQPSGRILREGRPLSKAVQVRQIPRIGDGKIFSAQRALTADLVGVVAHLLGGSYDLLVPTGHDDAQPRTRRVRASDIAILVNTNRRGQEILNVLSSAGIAASFTGSDSIFTSQAARDWLDLLEALTTGHVAASRRAALTSFYGLRSIDLAEASEQAWSEVFNSLREQARLLTNFSAMAVFENLLTSQDMYRRLLAEPGGERLLTDLRHMAEVLNQAQRRGNLSPAELLDWLTERITRSKSGESRERVRKLDTDRDAVTITTIHQAKGMEYPIVLVPELAEKGWRAEDQQTVIGHLDHRPVIDLDPQSPRQKHYLAEDDAEELRKAYVACTRARSLLVAWEVETTQDTQGAPIHRLLRNQEAAGAPPLACYSYSAGLRNWDRSLIDFVTVQPEQVTQPFDYAPTVRPLDLSTRKFTRTIDRTWTRTSYTGLTAALHELPAHLVTPASLVDQVDEIDEPVDPRIAVATPIDDQHPTGASHTELRSALAGLPGGTHFGSVVHKILERTDPGAADLQDELSRHCLEVLPTSGSLDIDPELLTTGLQQVLTTSLGCLTDGQTLADLGKTNQLAEFEFEMPMGGKHGASLAELARLMDEPQYRDPNGVLAGYGEQLAASPAGPSLLNGFLTGSIDVILRSKLGTQEKFIVLDYKTNRLPVVEEPLLPQHYRQSAMEKLMRDSHYPLQALLYCVALHRYLTKRQPDYQPDQHLGGVGYLFVRGMAGPGTPIDGNAPCGVFTWQPNPQLVARASDLLSGEQ